MQLMKVCRIPLLIVLAGVVVFHGFVIAEGDKIYLYIDNSLYAETEITSKVEMITISGSCAGFIKE